MRLPGKKKMTMAVIHDPGATQAQRAARGGLQTRGGYPTAEALTMAVIHVPC